MEVFSGHSEDVGKVCHGLANYIKKKKVIQNMVRPMGTYFPTPRIIQSLLEREEGIQPLFLTSNGVQIHVTRFTKAKLPTSVGHGFVPTPNRFFLQKQDFSDFYRQKNKIHSPKK